MTLVGGNDIFVCPRCGATSPADPRFVSWCHQCEFKADPDSSNKPKGRLKAWSARREDKRLREEFERCKAAPDLGSLPDRWRVVGQIAAVLVHLATLILLAGAVFVGLSSLLTLLKVLIMIVLVGFAFEVRPRVGKSPKGKEVSEDQAPVLWSLVRELCIKVGARVPDAIFVNDKFNAGFGMIGLRRRRCLVVGYPLWNVLRPDERVALLGHELAHDINRDLRASVLVGTALGSINRWLRLLSVAPRFSPTVNLARRRVNSRTSAVANIEMVLVPIALAPLFGAVALLGTMLRAISERAGQRAEYLADDLSCAVAGTAATKGLLEKVLVAKSCIQALASASRQGETDLWRSERDFVDSIPDYEMTRRRLVAASRLFNAESRHPPTDLRIRLVEARPASLCTIPDVARMSIIDGELGLWSQTIEQSIRSLHPPYISQSQRRDHDSSSSVGTGSMAVPAAAETLPRSPG